MQFADMLNEICKASTIKATTALSKFLQTPLGVDMRPVEIKKIDEIEKLNDHKDNMVNIFLPITGSLSGASFFTYTKQSALSLCDVLFHRTDGSTTNFAEPEISALSEVANIVLGSFLAPFAQSLQMDFLMHRSAIFDCGTKHATFANDMPKLSDKVINISFDFRKINIQGYVQIVFEEEKINTMLKNIS